MSLETLMKTFAAQKQMGELEFRSNRFYLTVDSQMEVACFQANGKFYVYGVIAELPEDVRQREELLKGLLQKNLALLMSERVSLCIEPEQSVLAIYLCRPMQGLNVDSIETSIATLVNNFELFLKWAHQNNMSPPSSFMMMP